ncbi:UDP-N-acetylmuramoyl-tripeptide--D-alanyl-D-alanine ligase [Xinfangfangia sp. CPCC 101601]|uniref:UDP-N-acetylmuramoyl-tripeptide--D-alanyl-D-alanine ligase n=1 Tax=Pseudogemmobacter lacusdianii TaxID=3069608 RepID=A0ABU0VTH5_9RHOB|nr:UDP-N-acetylmuramoyl-tripeptide--D-alanyl-D-alanine ligase [Xinfangfangia sp. CPCC 101601]MDQ2065019.1 UDP-N-acetylmuramoyl-tripeptide--D-alanyl-D-alanine ligase [Xinfangfangia sp. CPCC 101601]
MTLWTATEAAEATQGRATQDWRATGVSIDTRSLQKGDLFVALKDIRDGHDFVAQALEKGAAAALVSRIPEGLSPDAPLLIVDDVLEGLSRLGAAGRARAKARVVAITGSVGKTSTKEMLRAILSGQGKVHAAEASYNNHWGVPLTLARLPQDADFAVIEIGMSNPGEIAPLAQLARPHVAMITTIAPAHLAAFENIDGIADEKASIFTGLEPEGQAIINADLSTSARMIAAAPQNTVTFGTAKSAAWHLDSATPAGEATVCRGTSPQGPLLYKVATPGKHFALNALGALAAAAALGADPVISAHDIGRWAPPAGRGTRERILLDQVDETFFDLIDDAFNANPVSLAAALDVLIATEPTHGIGRVGNGRRIAILGDMLELGPDEIAMHRAVARHPGLAKITTIHCVGPRMHALYETLPRAQRGIWVETAAEIAPQARQLFDAGDIVLVKGSKGSKVSLVVDQMRKLGQRAAPMEGTE